MAGSPSLKAHHATTAITLCCRAIHEILVVNFVDLGVMYANLVFAESLNPQLHNSNPAIWESIWGSW